MSRHFVSKKEGAAIIKLVAELGIGVGSGANIEIESRKDAEYYLLDGRPFAYKGESFFPSLNALNSYKPEKNWVEVDDGAVPHLTNGANLFAGGITSFDERIRSGDLIFIRNNKGIYFCIMRATRNADEIGKERRGEVAKNVHCPRDKVYEVFREISR